MASILHIPAIPKPAAAAAAAIPATATAPTHGIPVGLAAEFALPTVKSPSDPAVQYEVWIPKHATLLRLLQILVALEVAYVVVAPAALLVTVVVPPTTMLTLPPPAAVFDPSRLAVQAS